MIYLILKSTNEVIREFNNVISWGDDFVEYLNNGNRAKQYADKDSYFTNEIENENQ